MSAPVLHWLKRLRHPIRTAEAGSTALMFGLSTVPLMLALGVAIDFGNHVRAYSNLQVAADAAALAAARSEGTLSTKTQVAQHYFDANLGKFATGYGASMGLSDSTGKVTVTASLTVPNYIMKLVRPSSDTISVTSEVTKEANGLEVVLVFDNTGSMAQNSRLTTLKQAARDFTNILFGDRATSTTLKVAIVPFSGGVNVGPANQNKFWIDRNGATSISIKNFNLAGWHNWRAWTSLTNRTWNGCVETRSGNYGFDDTTPSTGQPETLFTPYFAPDEPGNAGSSVTLRDSSNVNNTYYNSWRNDSTTGSNMDARQRSPAKYTNASVSSTAQGPSHNCQIAPITPLVGTKQTVLDAIDAMVPNGSTVIPEGLAWGLRVLSPTEPFTEGTAFNDNKIRKALILLTDGENDVGSSGSALPNHNKSWYSAVGYIAQNRLGTTSFSTFHSTLDAKTAQVCNLIKTNGVIVYSFAYAVSNTNAKNMIRNCASSPEKYFDPPSNAALVQSFNQIAAELRNLYLSR
jgi:Flp pilus assembly protein TadG